MDVTQNVFNTYKALSADGKIDANDEKIIKNVAAASNGTVDMAKLKELVKNDDGKISIDDKNLLHMVTVAQTPINVTHPNADFGAKLENKNAKAQDSVGKGIENTTKNVADFKNPSDTSAESANTRKLMECMFDKSNCADLGKFVNDYNKPGANKADIVNKLQAFLKDKGIELGNGDLNAFCIKFGTKVDGETLLESTAKEVSKLSPEQAKDVINNIKHAPIDLKGWLSETDAPAMKQGVSDVAHKRDGC
jgi:hypothetical protein